MRLLLPLRRALALVAFLGLAGLASAGCGLLRTGPVGTTVGAHMIVIAREGCQTAVARTYDRSFAVLSLAETSLFPQRGDLFEGPVRVGQSIFRFVPPDGMDSWRNAVEVPVEVIAVDLTPEAAREAFNEACGPPAPLPPGTRRIRR